MKIIKRVEAKDRVLGKVTCKKCTSELEITMADLRAGTSTDYGGDSESYVGFTCPVCESFQDSNLAKWEDVRMFQALENRKRIQSDSDGK